MVDLLRAADTFSMQYALDPSSALEVEAPAPFVALMQDNQSCGIL